MRRSQAGATQGSAHHNVELKESSIGLMDRVRANEHLVAVLKGLPLSAYGARKQQHESQANTSCTMLYSFDAYMHSIRSPAQALESLLQHTALDSEAKQIVGAMMRLRSEYVHAKHSTRG